jgi:DNA replication protein DnaC
LAPRRTSPAGRHAIRAPGGGDVGVLPKISCQGRQYSPGAGVPHPGAEAPILRESIARLAERARAEAWTNEELLTCLQREVSAHEAHGGEGRIRAARFPARKSLDDFDYDHARGLRRETIAHLGTLDFVVAKENGVLLGPPGIGKIHLATGLAIRACQG